MKFDRAFPFVSIPALALAALSLQASCSFSPSGIAPVDGAPQPDPDGSANPDGNTTPVDGALPDGIVLPDAPLPPIDAPLPPIDAPLPPIDAPLPCEIWMPQPTHFDPCDLLPSMGALTLAMNATYDTDAGTLRVGPNNIPHTTQVLTTANPQVRIISFDSFTINPGVTLRVQGSLPLIIASWSTITINGTIDASSNVVSGPGAGANTGTCNAATAGDQADTGGGGGGGGGFGDDGSDGGDGGGGDGAKGSKGTQVARPANVRGGCPGAKGGAGDRADGGGAGGDGGGAIQLTARTSITISGVVHAGGKGGGAADADSGGNDLSRRSGGGGGGSGGLIGLEAPTVTVNMSSTLAANGGGGGGGCDTSIAQPGQDGQPASSAAAGGNGQGGGGGNGATGAFRDTAPGIVDTADKGGGGGGGGVGYIIINATTPIIDGAAVISPDYVTP